MRRLSVVSSVLMLMAGGAPAAEKLPPLRPPSVPLVACDPYFSIWSSADRLTDAPTTHWTGAPHPLTSLVRIDGKPFRLMGREPKDVPALKQTGVEVLPTRTIASFEGGGIGLTVTFLTPMLPDNLMVLARPVTYLTWQARSLDGQERSVGIEFDASTALTVHDAGQAVLWGRQPDEALAVLRAGSKDQAVLRRRGDGVRIDWGHLYVAAPRADSPRTTLAPAGACHERFTADGTLPDDGPAGPRSVKEGAPTLAVAWDLGKVGAKPVGRWLVLAYDDGQSIQYFKQNLRPYWKRDGATAADLLRASAREYPDLWKRCGAFDREVMADLEKAGGPRYARIGALAYRQGLAGNKLAADANGQPLLFPKENTSNGCIATVDVIYPMAPQYLLFSPTLARAMLRPVLDYAASPRWKFPFAPHDLGTYPQANGQVYGGGERTEANQMPVEETGNMLILLAALAKVEGHAEFARPYLPQLQKWGHYLKAKGFDPENQLCTDDFAGHLAHNVNLSAKAIVALGACAQLLDRLGRNDEAAEYRKLAEEFAARWLKEADDGDHFRLTFNGKGTWSQKYNLVWDRLLGLGLFPEAALRKEMDFYKKTQNRYGLPLDSRKGYTKLDWTLWTACLTGEAADFAALSAPVYDFLNESPSRVPMSDWYETTDGKVVGFHARPVVGGVFLKVLYDPELWKQWAGRDKGKAEGYAPFPTPPVTVTVVPAADSKPAVWRYTTAQPAGGWQEPGFDAAAWKEGSAGFGAGNPPGSVVRTPWTTPDLWIRREFVLPEGQYQDLHAWIHHDEDVQVYLNGVLAYEGTGYLTSYEAVPLTAAGKAALRAGKNVLAVHCHQTTGGQYIDVGLVDVRRK